MKTMTLLLVTESGDELLELPLPEFAVAGPGEAEPTRRPNLREQLSDFCAAVSAAVAWEGMAVAVEAPVLRLLLSRAVLEGSDEEAAEGGDLVVRVPVRAASSSGPGEPVLSDQESEGDPHPDRDPCETERGDAKDDGGALLDGLFETAGADPGANGPEGGHDDD